MVILRQLAAIALIAAAIAAPFDVSTDSNEERSRGTCWAGGSDSGYAVCSGSVQAATAIEYGLIAA